MGLSVIRFSGRLCYRRIFQLVQLSLVVLLISAGRTSGVQNSERTSGGTNTCQCGVFLLGSPPLTYSQDAQPALAGNPVSADCSSDSDRVTCSTSCRSLVSAMSSSIGEGPLVQTVVLAATRALACQHFNTSTKVPLPRVHNPGLSNGDGSSTSNNVSSPKWLGGFYRWCDANWIYAAVSVPQPLCCTLHSGIPTKCADENESGSRETSSSNSRSPRLIIKKRPEDDLSSEELNDLDLSTTTTAAATTTTSTTTTEDPGSSMETILKPTTTVVKPAAETSSTQLNGTILAEAFQIVGALMRSMGLSDVVEGIGTVLPSSTATELLRRVDVGGWVGKYQDKYIVYAREFNMGYCYLEYGLYNVASEGGISSIVSRVFGKDSTPHGNGPPLGNGPLPGHVPHGPHNMGLNTRRVRGMDLDNTRQSGPNLVNMANMLLQLAGNSNGGGGGGESGSGAGMNSLLQNALPLMGQVASSPMIQGVVSNLVTSFLTPPEHSPAGGGQVNNGSVNRPVSSSRPPPPKPTPRPALSGPSSADHGEDGSSGLTSMLGQIVQTYIKHYFNSSNKPPPPPLKTRVPEKTGGGSGGASSTPSTSTTGPEERTDIVETISEVAKPFFISYFGVVPGLPGFGQLNIAERTGRVDTLTYDPDPGTSLTDLVFGSVNLPQTGNSVFDFGNRIAFAFSRANDPTQGMYCFKQYSVNKLWDSFRFGVKALFK